MNEEATRYSLSAIKKNFENKIEILEQEIKQKNKDIEHIREEKRISNEQLEHTIAEEQKKYEELMVKYKYDEDLINNSKGFKPGATEFDKMQGRINKLENEVTLYKKVIQKNERDAKKQEEEWLKEKLSLENDAVNLLVELRTVKEQMETNDNNNAAEIEQLKENYSQAKQAKDKLVEHIEFITNELKLVKEVNQNFRMENNRVMGQYSTMAKQIEDLRMKEFTLNENQLKLKKDYNKINKDLVVAKEEKEVAEGEYVRHFQIICIYSWTK